MVFQYIHFSTWSSPYIIQLNNNKWWVQIKFCTHKIRIMGFEFSNGIPFLQVYYAHVHDFFLSRPICVTCRIINCFMVNLMYTWYMHSQYSIYLIFV